MKFNRSLFVVAWALFAAGCGQQRPIDMPQTFPCSVTVHNESAPVADASVVLFREDGPRGISVNGKTNAKGVATVRTIRLGARYAEQGAPAGKYLVSIEKLPRWDGTKTGEEIAAMGSEEAKSYWAAFAKAMETLPREVPRSLSGDKKQPLEVVAGRGGKLTIDVAQFRDE